MLLLLDSHHDAHLKVNDISEYGSPQDVAKLLLPRGAKLLASDSEVVQLPPKETPIGTVQIKNTYYR